MIHPLAHQMIYLAESVSPDGAMLHRLFIYFMIAALFVFFAVVGFISYYLYKYRARDGDDEEPEQIHGNTKVEISLTLFTTAVVGFFFYLTISTMFSINQPAGAQKPDVVVTAHQWWWEGTYPGKHFTTANEIHIPADKKVLVQFKSADVIHDWWIPGLGRKMDIIPGRTNHLWLKVNKPGLYKGACSEFCGAQHAWMRIRLIVQPQDEFDQWAQRQSQPAKTATIGQMAALGKKLFNKKTCGNCHAIKGTANKGQIGPDLTHVGSRSTLLTGKIKNTPANLYRWIDDPQKIKQGANMPRFIFTKKQVGALTAYLEGLK